MQAENKLIKAHHIIVSVCNGSPLQLALQFPTLIPLIVKGLNSPLCAGLLSKLYLYFRKPAFISVPVSNVTVERVANTTLRLLKPKCELDPAWEDQDIGEYYYIFVMLLVHVHIYMFQNLCIFVLFFYR